MGPLILPYFGGFAVVVSGSQLSTVSEFCMENLLGGTFPLLPRSYRHIIAPLSTTGIAMEPATLELQ